MRISSISELQLGSLYLFGKVSPFFVLYLGETKQGYLFYFFHSSKSIVYYEWEIPNMCLDFIS